MPVLPSDEVLLSRARADRIHLGIEDYVAAEDTIKSSSVSAPVVEREREGEGEGAAVGNVVNHRRRRTRFRTGTTLQPLRLISQTEARPDPSPMGVDVLGFNAGAGTTKESESPHSTAAKVAAGHGSASASTSASTSTDIQVQITQDQTVGTFFDDDLIDLHTIIHRGPLLNENQDANSKEAQAGQDHLQGEGTSTDTFTRAPDLVGSASVSRPPAVSRSRFLGPRPPSPLPVRIHTSQSDSPPPPPLAPIRALDPTPVQPSSRLSSPAASPPPLSSPLPSGPLYPVSREFATSATVHDITSATRLPLEVLPCPESLLVSPHPRSKGLILIKEALVLCRPPTISIGNLPANMENRLTVRSPEISQIRLKAIEDARQMQAKVVEECNRLKKEPPPYVLEELIGKGSFGRVYKAYVNPQTLPPDAGTDMLTCSSSRKNMASAAVVAVKIIDIDESDTINPRNADSYSEFLKEVAALKLLSETNAKNINLVIDALPVMQAMWMITEYCGGGSVATLVSQYAAWPESYLTCQKLKPTLPNGLNEKWIIPIVREVAVAISWVHKAGIIHRDIKCKFADHICYISC